VEQASAEQNAIQQQEEELGRPLTELEREVILLRMTSAEVAELYIKPSGAITADDYDFWAGITSTVFERRAKAKEISAAIGMDVSWAECRMVAAELRKAEDRIEAEARGIPIEKIDPETGIVIGSYSWQSALRHVRAVETVATTPYEEYKAIATYPTWYTEQDKLRAYSVLLAESQSPVPVSDEFRAWMRSTQGQDSIDSMVMTGDTHKIVEMIEHYKEPDLDPAVTPSYIPPAPYIPQTQITQAVTTAVAPYYDPAYYAAILERWEGVRW